MPQLFHILPIFLPLAGQVLGQNRCLVIATKGERILWKNLKIDLKSSCCPERTVLGSDGNSGVYQLVSGFVSIIVFCHLNDHRHENHKIKYLPQTL